MTDTGILLLAVAALCIIAPALNVLAARYVRWRDRNAAERRYDDIEPLSDEWKVPR